MEQPQKKFTLRSAGIAVFLGLIIMGLFAKTDESNFDYNPNIPTVYDAITRPINSATFTVSATKQAYVSYSVSISCTATIGSAAAGDLVLQYSKDGGTTWKIAGAVGNSNTVTLAVVLNSVQVSKVQLSGYIPSGAIAKMVPTITGTAVISYLSGTETF